MAGRRQNTNTRMAENPYVIVKLGMPTDAL
jgi:hypothetical protein